MEPPSASEESSVKQTIEFYIITDTRKHRGTIYYGGRQFRWNNKITGAKFYPKIGSAKNAIKYHGFKDAKIVKYVATPEVADDGN